MFQKYQRNMTLSREAEEGEAGGARSPEPPEPGAARRANRKRRHDEVHIHLHTCVHGAVTDVARAAYTIASPCINVH